MLEKKLNKKKARHAKVFIVYTSVAVNMHDANSEQAS